MEFFYDPLNFTSIFSFIGTYSNQHDYEAALLLYLLKYLYPAEDSKEFNSLKESVTTSQKISIPDVSNLQRDTTDFKFKISNCEYLMALQSILDPADTPKRSGRTLYNFITSDATLNN